MSSLKAFPHLKRLDISLDFWSYSEFEKIFSIKYFPQQLTHLRLYFRFYPFSHFKPFKDIDIYLPKLQYLVIQNEERTGIKSAKVVENLSRLPRLVTINLRSMERYGMLIPEYYDKFTEKCPKIKTIRF